MSATQVPVEGAETPSAPDHTLDLDKAKPGDVVFEYGYIPCIFFGAADGKAEVARFGGFDYLDPLNVSTVRGDLPTTALPPSEDNATQLSKLQARVDALVGILKDQGVNVPAAEEAAAHSGAGQPAANPFGTD